MSLGDLPLEVWDLIFAYLDSNELNQARSVCKEWWSIINRDHYWKPKLLKWNVDLQSLPRCVSGEQELKNGVWADIYFRYYETIITNWENSWFELTECTYSSERVVVCSPYVIVTFDPHRVVEVNRLHYGKMVRFGCYDLPEDDQDGVYVPQMTTRDAFAVARGGYVVIFKYRDSDFHFEVIISRHSRPSPKIAASKVSNDLHDFVKTSNYSSQTILYCWAVYKDVVWLYDYCQPELLVYDYLKFEVKLRLKINDLSVQPRLYVAPQFVCFTQRGEIVVFSKYGVKQWEYQRRDVSPVSFCHNANGFAFILADTESSETFYIDSKSGRRVALQVENPIQIVLGDSDKAHVLFAKDRTIHLGQASTATGQLLWETSLGHTNTSFPELLRQEIILRIIFNKYLLIDGTKLFPTGGSPMFYSLNTGYWIWHWRVWSSPAKIEHIDDHFILTRCRDPRRPDRIKFELYNFLNGQIHMPNCFRGKLDDTSSEG